MRLVSLVAENFKRLIAVRLALRDGLVVIAGENDQGKSSTLDAVQAGLGGAKWSPDHPIRTGEESAKVVLETEEYKITRRWRAEGRDTLEIEAKDTGAKVKRPQDVLDDLCGGGAGFDAIAFSRMKSKDQAELLRKITGIDTAAIDGEREAIYAQRTAVNRQVQTLRAKVDGWPVPPDPLPEPEPEIDIAAMLWEIEKATKTKAKNDACRRELEQVRKRIAEVEAELAGLREREAKGAAIVAALEDPDITAIKVRADDARDHNARVRALAERRAEAQRYREEHRRLSDELAEHERVSAHHTARLEELAGEKLAILNATRFPVNGLGLDGDTVYYRGVPLEQASSSQKIRVGLAIAAALNPKLRVVLVRDGSLLDDATLAEVARWADEEKVQVLMERVGRGPGGIVIEDGRVAGGGA